MAMTRIHASALVDARAELDASVEVGAYSIIGPHVRIGADTVVGPHVVVEGHTAIGRGNRIFQFASIGAAPQDKKYAGEPTRLEIGDSNTIREFVTLNRGTAQDRGVTTIGSDNWIMAYVHVAHDCVVGDHTIFANSSNLAGHVEVGDWVILGGFTGVHQFCKIGAHAMTGVGTVVLHDIPPFVMASGNTAKAHGINSEGLRRRGFRQRHDQPPSTRLQDALQERAHARRGARAARRAGATPGQRARRDRPDRGFSGLGLARDRSLIARGAGIP